MQAFRNAAKPVVYLITITFMSWMILDLSGITGKGGFFTKTSVGSINGEPVDIRAFQAAVQNATTQRQQSGGGTMSLDETEQLRDDVWNQFIETTVVDEQVKKYHITTSPDEITEWIRNVPPQEIQSVPDFQTNGTFDLSKYQRWLASPVGQQYVPSMEAQAREQILRTKLFGAVTSDVYLSDASLWQRYRDQNEKVKISLTPIIGLNVVPDSTVNVSESDIADYYKAHVKDLARPKTAFMSFVAVPHRLDASDSAAALAHAKALRDEITGGTTFEEVAKRESSDSVSAKNGGDLGELTKGQKGLDPAFEAAAFALPVNTVSQPVLSAFGYHLIEVTKKNGDKISVRHILIPIELAGAHRNLVDAETDSLQRLAAERLDPAALDTVARALKLQIVRTGPVGEGSHLQLGTYVIPDAATWAFQAKNGETSPVIDGEVASYVFRLDSIQPAGTPTLAQMHDIVMLKVRQEKKTARAKEIAQDLIKRVNGGASLADASKALGLPNRDFDAFSRVSPPLTNPQVVGTAFGLPEGALSGVIDTPDGLYVIKVLQHIPADSAAFVKDKDKFAADVIRSVRGERVRDYLADLRETAKIQDNRNDIFKTNAQTEALNAAAQGKTGPQ
ncbi:MAG TPA: peptidyl-prolyl cis-trans isomerase [Gemmatimonadales bacterium]